MQKKMPPPQIKRRCFQRRRGGSRGGSQKHEEKAVVVKKIMGEKEVARWVWLLRQCLPWRWELLRYPRQLVSKSLTTSSATTRQQATKRKRATSDGMECFNMTPQDSGECCKKVSVSWSWSNSNGKAAWTWCTATSSRRSWQQTLQSKRAAIYGMDSFLMMQQVIFEHSAKVSVLSDSSNTKNSTGRVLTLVSRQVSTPSLAGESNLNKSRLSTGILADQLLRHSLIDASLDATDHGGCCF